MFQVLGLGTTWSQNTASVLKVLLLVKFGAVTTDCAPLSRNIGYNSFTHFLIATKRVTFSHGIILGKRLPIFHMAHYIQLDFN